MLDELHDTGRGCKSRVPGEPELGQTPFKIRAAKRLRNIVGSWIFLSLAVAFIAGWISLQLMLPHPFDPFPCLGLNLVLTVVAALQAVVILIADRDR